MSAADAEPGGSNARPSTGSGWIPQVRQTLSLLGDAVGPQGKRFGLIVAASVLAAALESAALVILPTLLLGGPPPGSRASLLPAAISGPAPLLAGYVALIGVGAALLYLQAVATDRLTLDFACRLRLRLHDAVMRAGWGTAALARPADLVHALTAEAAQSAFATRIAINLGTCLVSLPLLMAAALVLAPGLALAALALAAVAGLPMLPIARRAHALAETMALVARRFHGETADDLAGLKTLKTLGAEGARRAALQARLREVGDATLDQTRALAAARAGRRLAGGALAVGGAYYGLSVLGMDGASMLTLAFALVRLANNLSAALDHWRQLGRLLPVYRQFRDLEERCRAAGEPSPAAVAPGLRRELRLRGVAFSYPGAGAPTLAGIDLVLPAGSITAVVGPSGAGKSTLADLAMGLVAPSAGSLLIDGVELDGAARVAWRKRIAFVPQDLFLFHDTIRANLRAARADATDAELQDALDLAAAAFALRLPQGLDTVVGERGGRLSGGERQRLMLARALLRRPDLLVLDEATNALDPVAEAAVVANLRRLAGSMTILVIAHRSATIDAADRVLRLEGGAIVPDAGSAARGGPNR